MYACAFAYYIAMYISEYVLVYGSCNTYMHAC